MSTRTNPRIDSHIHVWDLEVRDQPWTTDIAALRRSFSMTDLRASLHQNQFDGAIVVQTRCLPEETPELLTLAEGDPGVLAVVGWVDLSAPNVADTLNQLQAASGGTHLVALRHQVQLEADPHWLDRADVRRGLAAVAAADLTYEFVVTANQLPAVVRTTRALPNLRFVLDHGGKPDLLNGEMLCWRTHLADLARLPNIAVKFSGLMTLVPLPDWSLRQIRPYADDLLNLFGAGRLMYGSDWPVCLVGGSYRQNLNATQQLTAALTLSERDAFFGSTAADWYGIAPNTSESGSFR